MEGQAVRRRISTITAHLLPSADEFSASHVLPMNCSSTLNSVIRRYDNRLYFARQGAYQSSFMRQESMEEVTETDHPNNSETLPAGSARRFDSRLFFARQGSAHLATFMRESCNKEVLPAEPEVPVKPSCPVTECSYYVSQERPLFSRPSTEPRFTAQGLIKPVLQGCDSLYYVSPERPMFCRPNTGPRNTAQGLSPPAFQGCGEFVANPPKFAIASRTVGQKNEPCSKKEIHSSPSNVVEWSPRMDVAESGRGYVITIEIPGVNVKDIRVEVDEKKLTVTGNRSTQYMKVAGCSNDSVSAYLRREIIHGPYSVIWPLPANVNKDCASAEFLDGFLRVVIPKL